MKKVIIAAAFLATLIGRVQAQDADPSMTEMVPPVSGVINLGATATMLVKLGNLGGDPIAAFSLRVQVTTGLNTEIMGIGPGSDPRWTLENLSAGNGNQIRLTNTAGGIISGEFANIVLNVKGKVLGGPLTVLGQVSYILGINPILGTPNAAQGDDPTNNTATTSLIVTTPAPLRFNGFTIKDNNCSGSVSWNTAEEQNVASFEVQQSFDGVNFTTVKTVASKGNGSNSYAVSFEQPQKRMYYRVVATDLDGRKGYGPILTLQLSNCTKASIIKVFPIPASKDQPVTLITNSDEKITYRLVDMLGKTVQTGVFNRTKQFNVAVGGTYILEMTAATFKETQTIVVQ